MSYTYHGATGLVTLPDREVQTFPSGLVRVTRRYVVRKDNTQAFAGFQVGFPLPNDDGAPSIDGLYIYPEPQRITRDDGFVEFRVTAYGRTNTTGTINYAPLVSNVIILLRPSLASIVSTSSVSLITVKERLYFIFDQIPVFVENLVVKKTLNALESVSLTETYNIRSYFTNGTEYTAQDFALLLIDRLSGVARFRLGSIKGDKIDAELRDGVIPPGEFVVNNVIGDFRTESYGQFRETIYGVSKQQFYINNELGEKFLQIYNNYSS